MSCFAPVSAPLLAVGPAVLDVATQGPFSRNGGAKIDSEGMALAPGGGAFNATTAAMRCGPRVALAAIMGDDRQGEMLKELIGDELDHWVLICAQRHTRVSMIVPENIDAPTAQQIYTTRSAIDATEVQRRVFPLIRRHPYVLIAPFSADDFPLVRALLAEVHRVGGHSFLQLSAAQLADRENVIRLISAANTVFLNVAELRLLTGHDDLNTGMYHLLNAAGERNLIVTDGNQGIVARVRRNSYSARAFAVDVEGDVGAGDVVAGTFAAAMADGLKPAEATLLASAAAAMHVSGVRRKGGWDELRQFAEGTDKLPRQRPEVSRRKLVSKVSAISLTAFVLLLLRLLIS